MIATVRHQAASILRVFAHTLYYTLSTFGRRGRDVGVVWQQLFDVGNRSVLFVLLTLGFLGAIVSLQFGFQSTRVFGDASAVGMQTLPLLVRQLGPTLVGLMVATRVGTAIAAEIGSMVVTEQVDALRMCGAPPVDHLVKPRFLACLVMLPMLTILGVASAFASGMLVAVAVFGTNPGAYANFDLVRTLDVVEGLTKALAYGAVIPVVAGASGLDARGGSAGVGEATTWAVVNASLAVIVLDFAIGGFCLVLR